MARLYPENNIETKPPDYNDLMTKEESDLPSYLQAVKLSNDE